MVFTQTIFLFYFLPFALFAHRIITRRVTGSYSISSRYFLIFATLVFYSLKNPSWLVPLVITVLIDRVGASWIQRARNTRYAPTILGATVGLQVTLLVLYKYGPLGNGNHPAGISFYVLESISFLIDVYRGSIQQPLRTIDIFSFLAMFPRFIAGPIVRYNNIQSQINEYKGMQLDAGLYLFIRGFFFKVCFADSFALFTGYAIPQTEGVSFLSMWIGVIAFALQVYFDFAGYSLMAIGLGKCFGFQFPTNFDRPFHASTLHEYWNRWHMTLGSWLKDYLFQPLALVLNRFHRNGVYLGLFLTMVLCGAWHGMSANFILWGAWHGFFLCFERYFQLQKRCSSLACRLFTLLTVFLGVGIYKAENFKEVIYILKRMLNPTYGFSLSLEAFQIYPASAGLALLGLSYLFFWEPRRKAADLETIESISSIQALFGFSIFLFSVIWVLSDNYVPFLYFQF